MAASTELKAVVTLHRRENHGDITELNAEARYAHMFEILAGAIATEREATTQEKQRSVEQRLVYQYVKVASSKQPVAPAATARPKAKAKAESEGDKKLAAADSGVISSAGAKGVGSHKLCAGVVYGMQNGIRARTIAPCLKEARRTSITISCTRT